MAAGTLIRDVRTRVQVHKGYEHGVAAQAHVRSEEVHRDRAHPHWINAVESNHDRSGWRTSTRPVFPHLPSERQLGGDVQTRLRIAGSGMGGALQWHSAHGAAGVNGLVIA